MRTSTPCRPADTCCGPRSPHRSRFTAATSVTPRLHLRSAATIGFMTEIVTEQLPADPLGPNAVVLVVGADTDEGYRLARELLCTGCRVAATARVATDLVRILHVYGPGRGVGAA